MPFMQVWTPEGWGAMSLSHLGLVLNLGHGCKPCPSSSLPPLFVTAIDVTGIHVVRISACECESKTDTFIQLIQNRWIPTPPTNTKVITSFRCLEQLQSLERLGITAQSFYKSLKGLPSSVKLSRQDVSC